MDAEPRVMKSHEMLLADLPLARLMCLPIGRVDVGSGRRVVCTSVSGVSRWLSTRTPL